MESASCSYRNTLDEKGVLAFVPRGNSMWPFFKSGKQTVIIVKPSAPLKRYDVALYTLADGNVVLHRVVGRDGPDYIMMGDSHFSCERVKQEQVIGVMQSFFKGKKEILASDKKYLKRVQKWCDGGKIVKFRKKLFHYFQAKKNKNKGNKNV